MGLTHTPLLYTCISYPPHPNFFSYWNYGVGAYTMVSEAISQATGGQVNLLALPQIPGIVAYPTKLGITKSMRCDVARNGYTCYAKRSC